MTPCIFKLDLEKYKYIEKNQKISIKIPKNATFDTHKITNLGIRFTPFSKGLEIIKKQF